MANVNTPIGQLPTVISIDGSEVIPLDQAGTTKRATVDQIINGGIQTNFPGTVEYVMDAGSGSISTGLQGVLEVPFPFTINFIDVYLSAVGSIQMDVLACTYDQYDAGATHPVLADSILGGTYPTITLSTKARVSYGNLISVAQNTILGFYVRSVGGVSKATISLNVVRTIS